MSAHQPRVAMLPCIPGLDELRAVMEAAGKSTALGSMDENMSEGEEEEEGEEEMEDYGLSVALARSGIA